MCPLPHLKDCLTNSQNSVVFCDFLLFSSDELWKGPFCIKFLEGCGDNHVIFFLKQMLGSVWIKRVEKPYQSQYSYTAWYRLHTIHIMYIHVLCIRDMYGNHFWTLERTSRKSAIWAESNHFCVTHISWKSSSTACCHIDLAGGWRHWHNGLWIKHCFKLCKQTVFTNNPEN